MEWISVKDGLTKNKTKPGGPGEPDMSSRDFKRAGIKQRDHLCFEYSDICLVIRRELKQDFVDMAAQLNIACDMNAEIQKLKSELKSHEENVFLKCLNERIESLLSVIVEKDAEMIKTMCENDKPGKPSVSGGMFKRAELHTRSYDNCHYIQYGKDRYVKITGDRGDDNKIKLLVAQLNAACDMEATLGIKWQDEGKLIKIVDEMGTRIERMRREKENLAGVIKRHVEKEDKLLNENLGLKNTISEMELEVTNVFNGLGVSKEHCDSFEGLKAIAIKKCSVQQLMSELATRGREAAPALSQLYEEINSNSPKDSLKIMVTKHNQELKAKDAQIRNLEHELEIREFDNEETILSQVILKLEAFDKSILDEVTNVFSKIPPAYERVVLEIRGIRQENTPLGMDGAVKIKQDKAIAVIARREAKKICQQVEKMRDGDQVVRNWKWSDDKGRGI